MYIHIYVYIYTCLCMYMRIRNTQRKYNKTVDKLDWILVQCQVCNPWLSARHMLIILSPRSLGWIKLTGS